MAHWPTWDREKLARRRWRFRLRLARAARVALRGSGTVTAALIATAVLELIAVGGLMRARDPVALAAELGLLPSGLAALVTLLAMVLLAVAGLAAGALSLRFAEPDAWARAAVAGRPFSEALLALAWEVRATCERFTRRAAALERAVQGARDADELRARVYRHEVEIRTALARLERRARPSHAGVRRLVCAFQIVSDEHGIPYERLCRYVLQYTPRVQHELVRRYLENWDEILSSCELSTDALAPDARLLPLAEQNRRIVGEARRCAERAAELARNEDLHPFVESFASHHSTSGSVLRYAQAVTAVARRAVRSSERARGGGRGAVLAAAVRRLCFLHQRQLGWAGVGLHAGCRNVCAQRLARDPEDAPALRAILDVLAALARGEDDVAVLGEDPKARRRTLAHLLHLEPIVAAEIERARTDLARRFQPELEPLLGAPAAGGNGTGARQPGLIVALGYSKAVREVLRRCLADVPPPRRPRILVVPASEERPFDAPRMAWDLSRSGGEAMRSRIAEGEAAAPAGLLEPGARAMILAGAEAFDDEGRALLARGSSERIQELLARLQQRGCDARVVVVAESWKRAPSLLADDDFFGHHAQGLEILGSRGPGADLCLTDGGPAEGRAVALEPEEGSCAVRIALPGRETDPGDAGVLYAALETLLESCGLEQAAGRDPASEGLLFRPREGLGFAAARRRLARAAELVGGGTTTPRERRDEVDLVRSARALAEALARIPRARVTVDALAFEARSRAGREPLRTRG